MSIILAGVLAGLGWAVGSDGLVEKGVEKAAERLFDGPGKRVLEEVQARLRAYTGDIPPNHGLEHAIRSAELTTTLVLLEIFRRRDEGYRFDSRTAAPPPFIAAARKWLHEQIGLCPSLRALTNRELETVLEGALDESLATRRREEVRTSLAAAERQVWDNLTAGAAQEVEESRLWNSKSYSSETRRPSLAGL